MPTSDSAVPVDEGKLHAARLAIRDDYRQEGAVFRELMREQPLPEVAWFELSIDGEWRSASTVASLVRHQGEKLGLTEQEISRRFDALLDWLLAQASSLDLKYR